MPLLPNSTEAGPGAPYWASVGSGGGGTVPSNLAVSTLTVSSLGSFSTLNANGTSISSLTVSSINNFRLLGSGAILVSTIEGPLGYFSLDGTVPVSPSTTAGIFLTQKDLVSPVVVRVVESAGIIAPSTVTVDFGVANISVSSIGTGQSGSLSTISWVQLVSSVSGGTRA